MDEHGAPLISVSIDSLLFGSSWRHCGQLANYLAVALTFDTVDAFLYCNLLSTILNEGFEAVFRQHCGQGPMECRMFRTEGRLVARYGFEVTTEQRAAFESLAEQILGDDVSELYSQALFGPDAEPWGLGLMGLVADYDCDVEIGVVGGRLMLNLRIDLARALEEAS